MSLKGLRFLVLLGEGVEPGEIRAALPPASLVRLADLRDAVDGGPKLVDETRPDLVVLGCSGHSDAALNAIRELSGRRGDYAIVVVYEGNPNGFMDPAFEAGADDLITLPQPTPQLAFAFEKVVARRRGAAQPTLAPMITILGPKGGTGKTLTACNLAVCLARAGAKPALVDIDLQFGDVGLALGLKPDHTIYDLAVAGGTLDEEKVEGFLLRHSSGVRALLAPVRPDQAAAVDITFLRNVLEILRSCHDFVIIDTPPAFSPEVIAAVDNSSHLCLVGMLDALSLKDTKIGSETLAQMGYHPEAVSLVLNRADTSVGISLADVEHVLGRAPDVLVPSDRAIPRGITTGKTIVEVDPRSGPARAFTALADRYLHEVAAEKSLTHAAADDTKHRPSRRRGLMRKAG